MEGFVPDGAAAGPSRYWALQCCRTRAVYRSDEAFVCRWADLIGNPPLRSNLSPHALVIVLNDAHGRSRAFSRACGADGHDSPRWPAVCTSQEPARFCRRTFREREGQSGESDPARMERPFRFTAAAEDWG